MLKIRICCKLLSGNNVTIASRYASNDTHIAPPNDRNRIFHINEARKNGVVILAILFC